MASFNKYQTFADTKEDLVEVFAVMIYFVMATVILPQFALFFGGAIEEEINLTKFTLYNSALAIITIYIVVIKFINAFAHMIKWDFEVPFFLHDPELSPFRAKSGWRKFVTDPRFLILGMLILGSFNTLSGLSQTGLPAIEQQVTETAQITFAIYPASPSETMTMITFLCVMILLPNFFLWRKFKYAFGIFCLINIVLFTIGGAYYGYWLHYYRYGASEQAVESVMVFWGMSGFVTATTGSCIPAVLLHDMNNAILSAKELFASSVISSAVGLFMGILILLMALFIISYINEKKKIEVDSYVETK